MPPEPARTRSRRVADTLERLRSDVDLWVASASETGEAYLVPLSFQSVALGADPELEAAHAAAAGFDPRELAEEYVYLRITPHEVQAWREANELEGRLLMRGGTWLERGS